VEEVMSKNFESKLMEDILSLIVSFSAKIYGRKSSQNRKNKEKWESE
jgi:predicted site-specific integrase-resolvase